MTSQLSQAGEIMLKHGFRHLPLVVEDEKVKYRLVGVISMRDLFQSYVRNETKSASSAPKETGRAPSKKKSTLGAVSTDPYFLQFLTESLAEPLSSEIKHVSFKDVHENLSKLRAVVLDLDHLKMTDWISLLKTINRKGRAPLTVVAFNPALFDAATVRTLEKLGHAPNIAVFAKPLAVSALLEKLAKARK
jgi:hypothetical protein